MYWIGLYGIKDPEMNIESGGRIPEDTGGGFQKLRGEP